MSTPEAALRRRRRAWPNVLLFALTAASTVFVGVTHALGFLYAGTGADSEAGMIGALRSDPRPVALGLVYAAVLLAILLAHEGGHFVACRRHGIDATLPYFIPAPTLIGTLGAFIRIKSPITRKDRLFDIGLAGPLAGFVLSLPALAVGLALSRPVAGLPAEGSIVFGEPLLLKGLIALVGPRVPAGGDLLLHPVAFAGWVGLLVTGLNLFPMGQFDGGHIAYALAGRRSRGLAKTILGAFAVMGLVFWVGWWVWALLILALGLKHPQVFDEEVPLSRGRRVLAGAAAAIFALSFTPAPVKGYAALELIKKFLH